MTSARRVGRWGILGVVLVASLVYRLIGLEDSAPAQVSRADFTGMLAAWKRSTADAFPREELLLGPVTFPRDHSAHVEAPAEHWDLLLRAASGERTFTLRVSIARLGAAPANRASRWAASQFLRSLVTMADSRNNHYRRHERYARNALDLGGFDLDPPRIRVAGNRLEWLGGAEDPDTSVLTIRESGITADLRMAPAKPPRSWEQAPPSGSRWRGYIVPRAAVDGTMVVDGASLTVQGSAWFSHGWGDLPPLGGQIALERWTLLLDDGSALVLLRLRRRDGSGTGAMQGTRIDPDGSSETLEPGAVNLQPIAFEGNHPVGWRLQIPDQAVDVKLVSAARVERAPGSVECGDEAIEIERASDASQRVGWGFLEPDGY